MCVFRAWVVYVVSMTEYNQEVPVTEGTNILQFMIALADIEAVPTE